MIVFGPVPSRRLGQSLGINTIPPKICTYSCIYCQLGQTSSLRVHRSQFYPPENILKEARARICNVHKNIDFITIVPDGEPTLDKALGTLVDVLREFGIKIAVITNASLLWNPEVQEDLRRADWVSVKIDAVTDKVWRAVNRPHPSLDIDTVLQGIRDFSKSYKGELTTETMLIKSINDSLPELEKIRDFIDSVTPSKSYIAMPTRPPAEPWATSPSEERITAAYQVFSEKLGAVEYLIGYEGNEFAFTGNIREDLLGIMSVHPMQEEGVRALLSRAGAHWDTVNDLLETGVLKEVVYRGKKFYMRTLPDALHGQ
ncbi:MAG: radical SAM protein [Theionarchaea archaeon]|nr:radical SAM protein [Theionarchaea archaeon]MBU7019875.1 radical SAM protein [Theionarchaea archaeon]MBU7035275.1 radical SAM protein [Theionarchaea archaeon]MBU7040935.1 radical SAM protein [Theionarchaea archaeon]